MIRIIHDDAFDLEYLLSRPALRHALATVLGFLFGAAFVMTVTDWAPFDLHISYRALWFVFAYISGVFGYLGTYKQAKNKQRK
jgi:hypothetical protein